jgi:hypothetical protein
MPLLNSWEFLGQFAQVRTLWIQGKLGSNKSALAYRLALELVKKKMVKHIVSNCEDVCTSKFEDVILENGLLNCVIITDEAGTFIRRRTEVDDYVNYARKQNLFYVFPSHKKPHEELRELTCRRIMDWGIFGINVTSFKWWIGSGRNEDEQGTFHWLNPSEIYGVYNTAQAMADDGGILDWLQLIRGKTVTRKATSGFFKSAEVDLGDALADLEDIADRISSSAESAEIVSDLLQKRLKKKKL